MRARVDGRRAGPRLEVAARGRRSRSPLEVVPARSVTRRPHPSVGILTGPGDDLLVGKLAAHPITQPGAQIEVVVELDTLHLFDAKTEQRLAA